MMIDKDSHMFCEKRTTIFPAVRRILKRPRLRYMEGSFEAALEKPLRITKAMSAMVSPAMGDGISLLEVNLSLKYLTQRTRNKPRIHDNLPGNFMANVIRLGKWKVRTLLQPRKKEQHLETLSIWNVNIVALQEVGRAGNDVLRDKKR